MAYADLQYPRFRRRKEIDYRELESPGISDSDPDESDGSGPAKIKKKLKIHTRMGMEPFQAKEQKKKVDVKQKTQV